MVRATSVRFNEELLNRIDRLAEEEGVDRSTLLRKAVKIGVEELLLRYALRLYVNGKISSGRTAELVGIPIWRLLDILRDRGIGLRTSEDDLRLSLKGLT